MLEDIPVCIDCKLEVVVFNRTPDRLAIKAHEDRGYLAQIYFGWITLKAHYVLWTDGAFVNVGKHAIEGDDTLFVRNVFLNRIYDFASLFF